MPQFGFTLNLKDEPAGIALYLEHHRTVWPEVLAGIRAAPVKNIQVYLHGRQLFMVITADEGFDFKTAFAHYEDDPVVRRWEELMHSLQEPLPDTPDQWWVPVPMIFDLAAVE